MLPYNENKNGVSLVGNVEDIACFSAAIPDLFV